LLRAGTSPAPTSSLCIATWYKVTTKRKLFAGAQGREKGLRAG
jgi:hypothetical protein